MAGSHSVMRTTGLILGCGLLLSACNPDVMNTKPEVRGLEGAAAVQTITDFSHQSKVTLRPDGTVKLSVESNPTTGYYWFLKTPLDEAVLLLESEEYIADPAPPGIVGSGGRQVFVFKGIGTGKQILTFSYERGPQDVAEHQKLTFEVTR